MAITFLFFVFLLLSLQRDAGCVANPLGRPDYESSWIPLRSQRRSRAEVRVKHSLGEVPLLIDVQVKSQEDPNKDFIFPAVGGCPRDDDNEEFYGGIIYIYNDQEVIVSAPLESSGYAAGSAIYTANDGYFAGPNNQTSQAVYIRVRAWKAATLPVPDYNKLDLLVDAGSTDVDKVYVEVEHDLGEYPGLVKVRAEMLDGHRVGYLSDAVGASLATFTAEPTSQTKYFVHGFNEETVRVWISSVRNGILFDGSDGYKISTKATSGRLQVYAWKTGTLPALIYKNNTQLGPNVVDENFEMSLVGTEGNMYVQVWAESLTGPNAGYRFPGSGALAYSETFQDPACTYGGLVYGYAQDMIRFWRPTGTVNSGIICISSLFGQNLNTQREVDANIVVSVWSSRKIGAPEWKEIENTCVHVVL